MEERPVILIELPVRHRLPAIGENEDLGHMRLSMTEMRHVSLSIAGEETTIWVDVVDLHCAIESFYHRWLIESQSRRLDLGVFL